MKIISAIIRTLMGMALTAFCAVIATFFITIFHAESVVRAIEIFKSLV